MFFRREINGSSTSQVRENQKNVRKFKGKIIFQDSVVSIQSIGKTKKEGQESKLSKSEKEARVRSFPRSFGGREERERDFNRDEREENAKKRSIRNYISVAQSWKRERARLGG